MNFSDVTSITIPEGNVVDISVNGVSIWSANTSPLPTGYTELEYVCNLSKAHSTYLTLNHKFNSTHSNLIIDYRVVTYSGRKILGNTNDTRTTGFNCDGDYVRYFGDAASLSGYMTAIHHYEIGKEKLYIDGELIKEFSGISDKTSVNNLIIGECANRDGSVVQSNSMHMIGRITLEYDNEPLYDLYPCKNPEGVVGFYDVVNEEFRRSESDVDWDEPALTMMSFGPENTEE